MTKTPELIHPDSWPAPSGRARVLIENPDGGELWAHADALRNAGYEVATCPGPVQPLGHERPTACPLAGEAGCPLAEGADVVLTTTDLYESDRIIRALEAKTPAAIVVEAGPGRAPATADSTIVIDEPVTEQAVLAAVAASLGR